MPSSSFAPLDSLPYLDPPAHPDYEAYAISLIQEEMQAMASDPTVNTSSDHYLKSLPAPPSASSSALLKFELGRLAENNGTPPPSPAAPAFHPASWAQPPKNAMSNDLQAWKMAVEQIKAKLETSHSTLTNLELQSTFGQSAWLTHNKSLVKEAKMERERLEALKLQVDTINAARQSDQEALRPKAQALTRKWQELVVKNMELSKVNGDLKRQKTS
ncbi:hypothetical protein TrRE_jg8027 [Triparma retinervis]|uniref:Pre-mRNA-splicing factor SPF27 n=1 Tax=Triparma retinervis TaxID=2557542 RepID=A0A9W7G7Z7_9STRA|nr:hypothetical protein TrRE_jg8027 [Triparma retinervis]